MTRMLRYPVLALSLWLLALMVVHSGAARAQEREVDVELFYTELDRHGRWFEHRNYGYVWSPDVDPDWRPYSRGRWVMTEENGWLWESDEPFGWAVFHYGRWFLDEDAGWVWVPGTVWGPAWVAWRTSDEQVGWAPLPPEAEWRGDAVYFSPTYYDRPRYSAAWCFVPVALLTSAVIYRHIYKPSRNVYFVRQTRWVPPLRGVGTRVVNIGFDRNRYERITRRPLTVVRIVDSSRPQDPRRPGSRNEIQIYRPRIVAPTTVRPPPRLVEPPRIRDGVPPSRQPATVPPTKQPQFIPPGARQPLPPQPPAGSPPRQPTTVPPVTKQPQFLPPPNQPPTTRQPTTVQPPPKQPQFAPPPKQPTAPPPVTKQPQFLPPPNQPPARQPTTVPPPSARPQGPPPPKGPPPQGNAPPKDAAKPKGRPPQPGDQPPPVPR